MDGCARESLSGRGGAAVSQTAGRACPTVLALDDRFDATGRTGANFSRINRDIRFAKDKTLYKTQMYLKNILPIARCCVLKAV